MRFILLIGLLLSGSLFLHRIHHTDRVIQHAARMADLDPKLLSAVAWQESRYDANATGKAGEIGMFQVMPSTAGDWARSQGRPPLPDEELRVLKTNARIAAWYLKQGMLIYGDKEDPRPYALARYNAGPTRVARWAKDGQSVDDFIESIGFESTKSYVKRVMARQ